MPRGEGLEKYKFGNGINDPSECGKKGGPISQEVQRRNRSMRNAIKAIFELEVPTSKEFRKSLKKMGFPADEKTTTMFMALFKQVEKAMKGDLDALIFLRDTIGEKPEIIAKQEADSVTATGGNPNRQTLANLLSTPQPDRDLNALIQEEAEENAD